MGVTRPPPATGLNGQHQRRVKRMLLLASGILGAACSAWGVAFAVMGQWAGVAFEAAVLASLAATVALTLQGRLRLASRVVMVALFVLVLYCAMVMDVPSPQVPRSNHQFLLVLAAASCLLLRDDRPAWRHGLPLAAFVAYMTLAASDLAFDTSMRMPEALRANAVWANHALAATVLYAVLHVLQTDVAERNSLELELRDALVNGDLLLHYQPQVDDQDRVFGAEALVRWRHAKRGLVPPGEFIPLAEQCGLMVPLGDWVLRTACAQLVVWQRHPRTRELSLAVNVSAVQLMQPDFVERVLARVEQSGADPHRLKLELTESVLATDLESIIAKMSALKAHGIGFSLDDFGTGFSSLSYLRRLPMDQLKIDQSFVRSILNSANDAAIAQTVITLGRSLGLTVIAEGVETLEQRHFLAGIGCHAYQGYLFGRPCPALEFEALLAQREQASPGTPESAPSPAAALASDLINV